MLLGDLSIYFIAKHADMKAEMDTPIQLVIEGIYSIQILLAYMQYIFVHLKGTWRRLDK